MGPDLLRAVRLNHNSVVPGGVGSSARKLKSNLVQCSASTASKCYSMRLVVAAIAFVIACLWVLWRLTYGSLIVGGHDSLGSRMDMGFKKHAGVQRTAPCVADRPCNFHVVADLDKLSKVVDESSNKTYYQSYLLAGSVWLNESGVWQLQWTSKEKPVKGNFSESGRGMELSELVRFYGVLLSFDDRTGIVYEVSADSDIAIARNILAEGNGNTSPKGMKIEWATERDGDLWIGSIGKEFTSPDGLKILNESPFWVVKMSGGGGIEHYDWKPRYTKMREALNATYPGYLIHETVNWSPHHRRWFVAPRRVSSEAYDEIADESRGSNKLLIADDGFDHIQVVDVGAVRPRRGFSSLKFIPGTKDQVILALKSEENVEEGQQLSYVTIFSPNGDVLLDDSLIPSSGKYEGVEFDDEPNTL